jgi:protein-tyrosine phosphatase
MRAWVLAIAAALAACVDTSYPAGPAAGGAGTGAAACVETAGAAACVRGQPVLTCEVTNARDLGGLSSATAGPLACGAVFRGPPLAALTADGCAAVNALGIETIIDLRMDSERASRPDSACVAANVVLAPLPIPYGLGPADYLADFDTAESMARIFQTFADPAAYPIYFHCTYGRDRTGVVAAALLLAAGVPRDDVMEDYLLSRQSVGAFPSSLDAVLNEIEARGGIDTALQAMGVTGDQLAALRTRLLPAVP